MRSFQTPLKDAVVVEPEPFKDERGSFARIFCQQELHAVLGKKRIVQVNHSRTGRKGAIRGMHFQWPPRSEIKMVKCVFGAVLDVIIDLRKKSPTFLRWHGEVLSKENMKMMYVPEGFAHGFQTLEEQTELFYFHTEYYSPAHEAAVRFDDPMIGIKWPLAVTDISTRDAQHAFLDDDFQGVNTQTQL